MSERDTTSVRRRRPDGGIELLRGDGTVVQLESRTDWARLAAMTEAEIEANARADPDNPSLTADELARMHPVPNATAIRERLEMTQEQFAARVDVPLGTLRDWERGARTPAGLARTLLEALEGAERERPTG
ncbi:MAG: helix-turn-helix domain-containing protein [Chloroflexia bacterium]|nr:helix-turn-helix domain-containing protein [Chloroflexia bacterium]